MTFEGNSRASADTLSHVHESPNVMLVPLYVLAAGAVLAGIVFYEPFIGHHSSEEFWREAIFFAPDNNIIDEFHQVPKWVKWSPTVMMILGFLLAFEFYIRNPSRPRLLAQQHDLLYRFLLNKWYFDELYDFLFVKPSVRLGRLLWKRGDGSIIDGIGPDGVAARVVDVTNRVVKLQTGYLYHYAFAMLIGVAALITWYMLSGN